MKRLVLLPLVFAFCYAGAQSTQLKITLNANQLPNADCWLNQGAVPNNKIYYHSGLCTTGQNFCRDSIAASGSPVWDHVVGNWGLDDGIGLMTFEGNNRYSITLIVENYYTQNISGGSTPMPNGSTPYTIGMVFRSLDGGFEGKDDGCGDIFIVDIQTSTPQVLSGTTKTVFTPVTVEKTIVGVEDPTYLGALTVSPKPSIDRVVVDYQLRKPLTAAKARILNVQGQEVAMLHAGPQAPGQHRFVWNGEGLGSGIYFFVLEDGTRLLANEKILLVR